jgi:polysaccharide pyruvyl transferase WcaK-like protein
MIKIGLIGHSFCSPNLGVGALAFGELNAIIKACKVANVDYQIICYETAVKNPYITDEKVILEKFNLKDIIGNARKFSKLDYIFDIGGGDSFSDIYGVKLYLVQLFIKLAILLSGTKLILPPQTYGPFKRWWVCLTGNYYIRKSKLAFCRDYISVECLNKINRDKVVTVADLGLSMSYIPTQKTKGEYTVGFNISGLLYQSSSLLGDNIDYKMLCHKIIESLKGRGYRVLLIPHVVLSDTQQVDNDYFVCKKLAEYYGLEDVIDFKSPKEAKSYISQCDLFIGSRMHATIAAVSSGVPTIPLAYSRKFKGVFSTIKYPYNIDLKEMDANSILLEILNIIDTQQENVKSSVLEAKNVITELTQKYIVSIANEFKSSI